MYINLRLFVKEVGEGTFLRKAAQQPVPAETVQRVSYHPRIASHGPAEHERYAASPKDSLMPSFPSQRLLFFETYKSASLIEAAGTNVDAFIELDWEAVFEQNVLRTFSKSSILHYFIYAIIAMDRRYDYRKNPEEYWGEVPRYKEVFKQYGIKLAPLSSNPKKKPKSHPEEYEYFYEWFLFHEESFEKLWELITEEVFYILFANRSFLLTFNLTLAEFIESRKVDMPSTYLTSSGRIHRSKGVPAWVKKAVFLRDHGRCTLCKVDLSGLISSDRRLHYDHIVPLRNFGTNDPCNLQLLCEKCNLRKRAKAAITSDRYSPWW